MSGAVRRARWLALSVAVAAAICAATGCAGPAAAPAITAAERLNGEGVRRLSRGELDAAEEVLRAALEEAELVDDQRGQAEAWSNLGAVAMARGAAEEAAACHRIAAGLHAARGGGEAGEARALGNLGAALLAAGRLDEAEAALEAALARSERLDPPAPAPLPRAGLSALALRRGETERAAALAAEALHAARDAGDDAAVAAALAAAGAAAEARGALGEARAALEEALALDRAREAPAAVASDLRALARVAERGGDTRTAASYLARAARVARRLGDLPRAERELSRAVALSRPAWPEDARRLEGELAALREALAEAAGR